MEKDKKVRYEDIIHIIDECLKRQRWKWNDSSIRWKQWDDVEQDIRLRIFEKWHTYDQSKPIRPWITQVISNKIFNIKRDVWGKFAKPCSTCSASLSSGMCSLFTYQSDECPQYRKWQIKKEQAYNMNNATSIDHTCSKEDYTYRSKNEFQSFLKEVEEELFPIMTERERIFYDLFFIQEKDDDYIIKEMDLQTPVDGQRSKTIRNLERRLKVKILKILEK